MWTCMLLLLSISTEIVSSDNETASRFIMKASDPLKLPSDFSNVYPKKKEHKHFVVRVKTGKIAKSLKELENMGDNSDEYLDRGGKSVNVIKKDVKQIKLMPKINYNVESEIHGSDNKDIDDYKKIRKAKTDLQKENNGMFQEGGSSHGFMNALSLDYHTSKPDSNAPKQATKNNPFEDFKSVALKYKELDFTPEIEVPYTVTSTPFRVHLNYQFENYADFKLTKVPSTSVTQKSQPRSIEVGVNKEDKMNIKLDIGDVKIAIDAPKNVSKHKMEMFAQMMYSHLMEMRMQGADGSSNTPRYDPNINTIGSDGEDKSTYPYANVDNEHNYELREPSYMGPRLASEMYQSVRVLCLVMTQPERHKTMAMHVKATWGNKCNELIFMSSAKDQSLPAVHLYVRDGRQFLWAKTKEAFSYVYKHHRNDADWFLRADDDTFVIVENLRSMLAEHNSEKPMYFGCRFKPYTKQGYMSGGAGYVISRAALDKLNRAFEINLCGTLQTSAEDVELGKCMERIGVRAMDSRDSKQRGRFFPFPLREHLFPDDESAWYYNYLYYTPTVKEGLQCCSNTPISFHGIQAKEMYILEYLIYRLRPHGPPILENEDDPKTQASATALGRSISVELPIAEIHYNSLN